MTLVKHLCLNPLKPKRLMALSIAANVMDLMERTPLGDTQNVEGDIRPLPIHLVGAGESTDFPD